MKKRLKEFIRGTPLYHPVRNWLRARRRSRELRRWERQGRPVPPPHVVKQRTINVLAERFGLKMLVETGTYYGDMVEAMKRRFTRIYSIELSKELSERAAKRFRGDGNVEIIHGDSGTELGKLVRKIDQPALFYLDGHYSAGITARGTKDTPIYEELAHIFDTQNRKHVIVIDDARCFGNDPGYPSMQELREFIRSKRPDVEIEIEDDSIKITPRFG
ncbi:MAG: hypothetical protein QOD26_4164 [Betaproteobacteria bacterium]|jgi:hypothetical protein|nr:hypothetical protein [Betaproteobacteria bacterium]